MPASIKALLQAFVLQLALPAARTATLTGTALDTLDYEGQGLAVLHSAKGSGASDNTLDCKLQESDTSGGVYTDVAGGAFTQVLGTGGTDALQAIPVDFTITKRYLKVIGTIAGSTPSFVFGVTLVGMKKYKS